MRAFRFDGERTKRVVSVDHIIVAETLILEPSTVFITLTNGQTLRKKLGSEEEAEKMLMEIELEINR